MNFRDRWAALMAGTVAGLALASTATAQVSADAILDKLVAKGVLNRQEADQLKTEASDQQCGGGKWSRSPQIQDKSSP
jgi:polyhydroxyalkanoate synthesis regulator phasin